MSSTNQDTTFPARQAIAVRNQLSSPFLQLSGEIRNRIYYFALGSYEIYLTPSDDDNDKKRTLQCRPNHQNEWDLKPVTSIMAINLLMILPIVILFLAFQKYFVEGLARSGLK